LADLYFAGEWRRISRIAGLELIFYILLFSENHCTRHGMTKSEEKRTRARKSESERGSERGYCDHRAFGTTV